MATKKKKQTSIGCLFWIALILLIIVVFLFNKDTIQTVLHETGFMELIEREHEEPEVSRELPEDNPKPVKSADNKPEEDRKAVSIDIPSPVLKADEEIKTEIKEDTLTLNVVEVPEKPSESNDKVPETPQKVRRSKLYFVSISDTGEIQLKQIVRPVYYQDSPLTETLKTLLSGLTSAELNMGLISLIPDNTELLSVNVKNNTAYIDFSESFRFSSFGSEGHLAQLKQIVYTATEFSNINAVQFLIEGKKNDYMGPEGVYIGAPLTRADF